MFCLVAHLCVYVLIILYSVFLLHRNPFLVRNQVFVQVHEMMTILQLIE